MSASLGKNIQHLCDIHKVNLTELSKNTGIKPVDVHSLASGKNTNPHILTIKRISEFFNIKLSQLIGEEDLPQHLR